MRELHELIETCKIVGDTETKVELCRYLIQAVKRGAVTEEKCMEIRHECHLHTWLWVYVEMELMENESEENEK